MGYFTTYDVHGTRSRCYRVWWRYFARLVYSVISVGFLVMWGTKEAYLLRKPLSWRVNLTLTSAPLVSVGFSEMGRDIA